MNNNSYFRMKSLLTNRSYLFLMLGIGGAIGLANSLVSMVSQFLCSRGYTEQFVGILIAICLGVGFIGGVVVTIIASKTQKFELISRILFGALAIIGIATLELMRVQDIPAVLIILFIGQDIN